MKPRFRLALTFAAVLAFVSSIVTAAGPPPVSHTAYQTRPIQLGTSGGNVNDRSNAFCCSGTLGSLVTDGSNQYILSNNHVLARVNQAATGEAVDQPGLIDESPVCADISSHYVAHLTRYIPVDFRDERLDWPDAELTHIRLHGTIYYSSAA